MIYYAHHTLSIFLEFLDSTAAFLVLFISADWSQGGQVAFQCLLQLWYGQSRQAGLEMVRGHSAVLNIPLIIPSRGIANTSHGTKPLQIRGSSENTDPRTLKQQKYVVIE